MPRLPTVNEFMQPLYDQIHKQFHLAFPGEAHDGDDVLGYLRGWLHGVRFAVEYRKWARIVERICYHTDGADLVNPPLQMDATAAWLSQLFGPDLPTDEDFVKKLQSLREVTDGPGEAVVPALDENGQLTWVAGKMDPSEWWSERWGDE